MITSEKIYENWQEYRQRISTFTTRKEAILNMVDNLEERLCMAPASGVEYYHNAFDGGYIDHVLRVMDYSEEFYDLYKKLGLITDNFTKEELLFAAMHHDLGKVGFPEKEQEGYLPNDSEWHRKNQGKIFVSNPQNPFAPVQDKSLFLLQYYKIECSWNEWHAIRTHDGPFERVNEPYWIATNLQNKMRTNLATILHQADYAAARWEFERWALSNPEKFKMYNGTLLKEMPNPKVTKKPDNTEKENLADLFTKTFNL
jgi:hypothetical protein